MKKSTLLITISAFVFLSVIMQSIFVLINNGNNSQKFVGKIAYIHYGNADQTEPYYVYLNPIFSPEREDWVMFEITPQTQMETTSNESQMKLGNIIEIVYSKNKENKWDNYKAISIKIADESSNTSDELSLNIKENYSFDKGDVSRIYIGQVVHIAKINISSVSGYIVYIDDPTAAPELKRCWIDERSFINDSTKELLENRIVGYTVELQSIDNRPFDSPNDDISVILSFSVLQQ